MSKTVEIDIPTKSSGTFPCAIRFISHRNKSETVTCKTTLENGKEITLTARLTPLPKPDENGHEWFLRCEGSTTHVHDKDRWTDALLEFQWYLEFLSSVIRNETEEEAQSRRTEELEARIKQLLSVIVDLKSHLSTADREAHEHERARIITWLEERMLLATYSADPTKFCWGVSDAELKTLKETDVYEPL